MLPVDALDGRRWRAVMTRLDRGSPKDTAAQWLVEHKREIEVFYLPNYSLGLNRTR